MADIFKSAAAQVGLEFGLAVVVKGCEKAYDVVYEGSDIKKLGETVNGCSPAIDKLYELTIGSPSKEWIQNIHNTITEAKNLVNASGNTSVLGKFREAGKAQELQDGISKSMQNVVLPNMAVDQTKLLINGEDLKNSLSVLIQLIQNLTLKQETMHEDLKKLTLEQTSQISPENQDLCRPPDKAECLVGFDDYVAELKELVLKPGKDVVGVTAIGGAGKSTLTAALCHHPEIEGYFKRVIYIVVSESPDLLSILKIMWRNIVGGLAPDFRNVEGAHIRLQQQIISRTNGPILVVLDDIWQFLDLKELLFKGEQYMTIVTTRDKKVIQSIPRRFSQGHYPLPSLQEEHALKLFCRCAFNDMSTIPNTHTEELVKQVQTECKGLPLALQVIGRSLKDEPLFVWKATRDALARGEVSDDNQIEVFKRLVTSIDVLKRDEKKCFLDLAIFPKGRIIPANVLLDIWVYVRRMKREQAVLLLRKFAARHLLDLKRDPWTPESTDDCTNSYSISQHDVIRQLALFLAEQDNKNLSTRLYMSQKQSELPSEWQTYGYPLSEAQIVSVHTGAMQDTDWPKMKFPNVEALVLYFTATEYCIPTFLNTMEKLKVLIIHNDNAKRAKLSGLGRFQDLSQLKTLHLERLIVPPLHQDCKGLKNLHKIYLSLCDELGKDKMFNLPALLEFNVDHCSDLQELSAGICSSKSLKLLSITHCHKLAKLPDDLNKLVSLEEIRLCQSPGLKALPPSICSLENLQLLNISSCEGLKENSRKDPKLKDTFQSLAQMPSLKSVICDKDTEQLFRSSSKPDLKVVAVVEKPSLNWVLWGTD